MKSSLGCSSRYAASPAASPSSSSDSCVWGMSMPRSTRCGISPLDSTYSKSGAADGMTVRSTRSPYQ